ncbi:hypothetical protein EV127DRAFT_130466 [Xylaria flabelliformis]|nr:hypothetical protein EV127DRAFT_130466 [Xylaria flabelliformis]
MWLIPLLIPAPWQRWFPKRAVLSRDLISLLKNVPAAKRPLAHRTESYFIFALFAARTSSRNHRRNGGTTNRRPLGICAETTCRWHSDSLLSYITANTRFLLLIILKKTSFDLSAPFRNPQVNQSYHGQASDVEITRDQRDLVWSYSSPLTQLAVQLFSRLFCVWCGVGVCGLSTIFSTASSPFPPTRLSSCHAWLGCAGLQQLHREYA